MRVEVLSGVERRRQWSDAEKARIVEPVELIVYPAPCICATCGGARLRKLDDVVSRSLECEPRRWKIIEHVREKMTCRDCEGVTETPAPSHLSSGLQFSPKVGFENSLIGVPCGSFRRG